MVTELLIRGLRIQGRRALLQSRARSVVLDNDLARLLFQGTLPNQIFLNDNPFAGVSAFVADSKLPSRQQEP